MKPEFDWPDPGACEVHCPIEHDSVFKNPAWIGEHGAIVVDSLTQLGEQDNCQKGTRCFYWQTVAYGIFCGLLGWVVGYMMWGL